MIETSLVYIFSIEASRPFRGCGAVVEGGYVATCRHVWRDAGEPTEVEIEFPFVRENGVVGKQAAGLADLCDRSGDPAPDVVLLKPAEIPCGVMVLQNWPDEFGQQDKWSFCPRAAKIAAAQERL